MAWAILEAKGWGEEIASTIGRVNGDCPMDSTQPSRPRPVGCFSALFAHTLKVEGQIRPPQSTAMAGSADDSECVGWLPELFRKTVRLVTLGVPVGLVRGHAGVVVEPVFEAPAARGRLRAGPVFDRVRASFLASAVVRQFMDQDAGGEDLVCK